MMVSPSTAQRGPAHGPIAGGHRAARDPSRRSNRLMPARTCLYDTTGFGGGQANGPSTCARGRPEHAQVTAATDGSSTPMQHTTEAPKKRNADLHFCGRRSKLSVCYNHGNRTTATTPAQAGQARRLRGRCWIASRREVAGEGHGAQKLDGPLSARPSHRQERRGQPRPRCRRGAWPEKPDARTIQPGRAQAPARDNSESIRHDTPRRTRISCACQNGGDGLHREGEGGRGLSAEGAANG
jgi:hypothetical protein